MADFTNLNNSIAALSAKVDALIVKAATPAPAPDLQPQIDAVTQQIDAVAAKIPA